MQIKITPRTLGGTEFTAQPARLHLGAQNAEGVDRLVFQLPAEWAGCSVTLHIRHSDGTLAAPLVLDAAHSAPVGRSFTGWPAGQWMLAATDGSGYTAYTRPGRYDVYDILPTDGTEEEPSPSVYEQFIAQVGRPMLRCRQLRAAPPVRPVPPGRRRPLPTLPSGPH